MNRAVLALQQGFFYACVLTVWRLCLPVWQESESYALLLAKVVGRAPQCELCGAPASRAKD